VSGVVETVGRRLAGERPSRFRAFVTACVAGAGTGALVYKLLRSSGNDDATS